MSKADEMYSGVPIEERQRDWAWRTFMVGMTEGFDLPLRVMVRKSQVNGRCLAALRKDGKEHWMCADTAEKAVFHLLKEAGAIEVVEID